MSVSLKKKIQDSIKVAMREKDKIRLATLRGLLSAVQYEEMKGSGSEELPDSQVISVVQSEIKKRRETLELLIGKSKSQDEAALQQEVAVLEELLPPQLDTAKLESEIRSLIAATDSPNIGTIMKQLGEKYSGRYDPRAASAQVKALLSDG